MTKSRFHTLLDNLARSVAADYAEAREHARQKDSQRAGHEGESTWQRLLEQWGPNWPVVTRKYIVGPDGTSNEIDVVVLKPDYPAHLQAESSVSISGVAAAFSSKLTLRRPDIAEAIDQKKRLVEIAGNLSSPAGALVGPFPFGLLAHSTEFLKNSPDFSSEMQLAYEGVAHGAANPLATQPNHELDALLVADRGFFSTTRVSLIEGPIGGPDAYSLSPMSSFSSYSYSSTTAATPLVQFITWVSSACAGTDSSSLSLLAQMFGIESASGYMTRWPLETYPEHIRRNLSTLLNEYGLPKTF